MSLGEVSRTLEEFRCVCCIFGRPDKRPDKCERVMGVQFFESLASPPFTLVSRNMCLSCSGSRRCKVDTF